ncbi:MAG: hypothetical protein HY394_03110 [Candidatus Diapherotrites archaeon]|nr:hypothetical protein [Candidatus Diapherotrites archaeon]
MTKKVDEDEIFAIIYSNFKAKGKQTHDWIFLAEKFKELKDKYKSDGKVAKLLSLSREMVRSTIKLLDLPSEIKQLIKENKITQDLGWRLLAIKNKEDQIRIANSIVGLSAHDARDMIRFAKNNRGVSIENQINRLKKSKELKATLNLVVVSLENEQFEKLKKIAKKQNKTINQIVTSLVTQRVNKET